MEELPEQITPEALSPSSKQEPRKSKDEKTDIQEGQVTYPRSPCW